MILEPVDISLSRWTRADFHYHDTRPYTQQIPDRGASFISAHRADSSEHFRCTNVKAEASSVQIRSEARSQQICLKYDQLRFVRKQEQTESIPNYQQIGYSQHCTV